MSNLAIRIKAEILAAIDQDQLTLPTLPEIALRVRDVAQDDRASIIDLSRVIAQDAALAARIVRISNSPLLRGTAEVSDLTVAISRLGMNYTANVALGLAMEQIFQATSDMVDKAMRALWQETGLVATYASVLAQQYTKMSADQALLAGLIHRIGALPVLSFAEDHDELIKDESLLLKLMQALEAELGEFILRKWHFSQALIDVAVQYPRLDDATAPAGLAALIRVARLLGDCPMPAPVLQWSQVPAFALLGIPSDPENEAIIALRQQVVDSGSLI